MNVVRKQTLEIVIIVPSLRMAITRTIKGEKSNSHIRHKRQNPTTIRTVMDTAYMV